MGDEYEAIQSERLYTKIVDQIQRRIMSGELKEGDQLPSERELAEQFRVSRTAVREAVKALSEKGLLQIRVGRGTFVTNGTLQAVRDSLGRMMQIGKVDGPGELVEVREIIEPEIAALAAVRANQEHISAMQEAVSIMDHSLADSDAYIEADLDFHLALAEATENTMILTLIDSIVDLLREQRIRIFHVEGGPQRGQIYHKRILEAVTQRNATAAREAMQAHLEQVRKDSQFSSKA